MVVEKVSLVDYQSVKDRIVTKVVNPKTTQIMDRPHTFVSDLAVVYDIEMFNTNGTRASMRVNNQLFSQWNISVEELHANALVSTPQRDAYVLSNLDDELWGNPVNFLEGHDYVNGGSMLVASNENKMFGANILADSMMMEKISQVINDDMYIIPSSVHELLILPKENAKDFGLGPKDLEAMVRDVNATQVEPHERLSNRVYEYNRDEKEVSIAKETNEKVKAMER